MKKTTPLLTIFIPTFNGADSCLDLVLESVIRIATQYDDVEIVVSDNCSTDKTQELCASFQYKCPNLFYHRNRDNIGFNFNMLKVSDYAQGEYAWIIGDDDIIEIAYFNTIYQLLKKRTVDLISVGFSSIGKNYYRSIDGTIDAVVNYASFQEVVRDNCPRGNTLCTFIGCTIFRLKPFNELPKDFIENKFDCDYNIFPNAYLLVMAFINSSCAYINNPVITCVDSGRIKSYEKEINGWITIDTKAIIELYEHFIKCGVEKSYLRRTKERIIYDFIIMGVKMRKYGYDFPNGYSKYVLKTFCYPRVLGELIRFTANKIFRTHFVINI